MRLPCLSLSLPPSLPLSLSLSVCVRVCYRERVGVYMCVCLCTMLVKNMSQLFLENLNMHLTIVNKMSLKIKSRLKSDCRENVTASEHSSILQAFAIQLRYWLFEISPLRSLKLWNLKSVWTKPKFWSHLLKVTKAKPKVNKVLQNFMKA
jgi:hypothetical protein